jgi:hypothetical protein
VETVLRLSSCRVSLCNFYLCFVLNRILSACKTYALSNGLFYMAAFLSSYFLTRADVKEIHLPPFLDWTCNVSEHFS